MEKVDEGTDFMSKPFWPGKFLRKVREMPDEAA